MNGQIRKKRGMNSSHMITFSNNLDMEKNRRSVPEGFARKETWQMLMEDSTFISNRIQMDWKDIHSDGYYPGTFRESEGCLIPKGNAKSRCKAVRMINKRCPAGKSFTSMLWSRSQTKKRYVASGFTRRRR